MVKPFNPAEANQTLFEALLDAQRVHGADRLVLEDIERQPLSYGRLILASLVLGHEFARDTRRGEPVGVLLPNVNGMVVTLLGLNAYGRVAALLNFSAGIRNISSAVETGVIRRIVTSRRFVASAKLEEVVRALAGIETASGKSVEILYLEDIRKRIGPAAKLAGLLKSKLARQVHRRHAARPDRPAIILFTSGTEGVPKGVVLTNANLVANARQIFAHAEGFLTKDETVLNPLPMFHSFGLTAATLMPLLSGMRTVLYPSPLHYKEIPALVSASKATVLFATDTFLQGYARAARPDDLKSLRYIIAGAEKVRDATRTAFALHGTMILEGYGATECAPVICCNLPNRTKPGSVGPLLPGITARLDPVAGVAGGGRLVIKGPNVMAGYMLAERPGVLVAPAEGWHDTGDIVDIDDDGLVSIKGRATRFAKIGGEMVSLAAVEGMVATLWPDQNHVVIALPDPRRGEQLVLVTDHAGADRQSLTAAARQIGLPELWVPRHIHTVAAIPVLASGKVDFGATNALVKSMREAG